VDVARGHLPARRTRGGPRARNLRERLVENFDAAIGAAVTDPHGLLAILVFGQRLMANAEDDDARTLLDAFASLAALAWARAPRGPAARGRGRRAHRASHAPRSMRCVPTTRRSSS